jgi:hypothetical protein
MSFALSHFVKPNSIAKYLTTKNIQKVFNKFLPCQHLGRKARETAFKQRACNFEVTTFVYSLIAECGSFNNGDIHIEDVHRLYNQEARHSIESKPFYEKMDSPECVNFMQSVTKILHEKCMLTADHRGKQLIKALHDCGLEVEDVEATDGTYWVIDNSLAEKYPGKRNAIKAKPVDGLYDPEGNPIYEKENCAMIGLQNTYSLKTGCIKYSYVGSSTVSERDYVQVKEGKCILHLMDDGYIDTKQDGLLEKIDSNGSYYIVQGRGNHACKVISAKIDGRITNLMNGEKISEFKYFEKKSIVDAQVEFANGFRCRLIRFWNKKDKWVSYLLTNISANKIKAAKILNLFRLRWQCEINWKFLKSGNALRGVKTCKETIVMVMMLASVCAYMVKHLLTALLSHFLPDISEFKIQIRLTPGWFVDFMRSMMNSNEEKVKAMIKKLISSRSDFRLNRQHISKELRHATYYSVIKSLIEDGIEEPSVELLEIA